MNAELTHLSPTPSLLISIWWGLYIYGQLSSESITPSTSMSWLKRMNGNKKRVINIVVLQIIFH
jgi:hypothetical protein